LIIKRRFAKCYLLFVNYCHFLAFFLSCSLYLSIFESYPLGPRMSDEIAASACCEFSYKAAGKRGATAVNTQKPVWLLLGAVLFPRSLEFWCCSFSNFLPFSKQCRLEFLYLLSLVNQAAFLFEHEDPTVKLDTELRQKPTW
jgi:hypothetical protein